MKKILLFTLLGLFTSIVNAQIVMGEQPYSMNVASKMKQLAPVVLSALDRALIAKEDAVNDDQPGPVRYAYPTNVNYTLDNSGVWQTLEDGSKIWRLKVKLPGALSTNTYYNTFWLPEGAKFFVYSEETKQSIGAITSQYIEGSKENPIEFATALVYGEDVVFEYYQPASVKEAAVIAISRIDYGYRYVNNPYADTLQDLKASASCEININCPEGSNWQIEKNAVARVSMYGPSGSGWCSCALVNNTDNDYTPYVLTANHCLSAVGLDAVGNNNAGQCMFYWEYEYPGCSNGSLTPFKSTTGATVTANNADSDFGLFLLTQDPRNIPEITLHYLGWDRSGNAGTGGVGIHHPGGDVKKISASNQIQNYPNQIFWDDWTVTPPNTHWNITFYNGLLERGASGSPFIDNSRRVIGQLHGGSTVTCASTTNYSMYYGKFDVSWTGNGDTNNRRRLQHWLDPAGTNPDTLNGITFYTIVGSDVVGCNEPEPFTVSQPSLPSYSWSVNGPLSIMSGQGTSHVFVSTNVNAPTTATIILNGSFTRQVRCGLPMITGIDGHEFVYPNTPATYTTIPYFPYSVGECMWYVDGFPTYDSMGGSVTLSFTPGSHVLTAAPWSCYMSDPSPGKTILVPNTYNVVSGTDRQITVTLSDDIESDGATPQSTDTGIIKYTLTEEATGTAAANGQLAPTGGTLDFTHLPAGAYTFRINSINDRTLETHDIVLL
ncbi:MAG: serine protease [Prevotellaceae bacterium]|jgi:hypothetical protein|nr:serine protease [Prevotellaceae bacterium]